MDLSLVIYTNDNRSYLQLQQFFADASKYAGRNEIHQLEHRKRVAI